VIRGKAACLTLRHLIDAAESTMKALRKSLLSSLLLASLAGLPIAHGEEVHSSWRPVRAVIQTGVAENASAVTGGFIWTSDWHYPLVGGVVNLYWEATMGRWRAEQEDGRSHSAWITQLGITPVFRWHPANGNWFAELGIGANFLLPIYRSRDKRFSTTFNFGDHIAVGWYLDAAREHELALRLQHFSNAGIKHPNPGEDFLQVRYSWKF
jgi:lipid A 3-O-deacylase